jgi:anti-anti-sigma factor
MDIQRHNGTLSIRTLRELSAANARSFRNEVCAVLAPGLKSIEIDLTQTHAVDSCGLGALVSLYKAANERGHQGGVRVRLLNPQPQVQQLLELTRMHHLFEIVPPGDANGNGSGAAHEPVHPALPK